MKTNSPRPFTHIDTWVFDLDNTLYPHHVNLWQQVDARIGEFISAFLKISAEEARVIQKDYYRRYGTSMRGMMTEHGVHADDYLAYVHKIDHSPLEPNPAMGAAIAKLPGRKLILTNGSTDHAGAVLERLGLAADHQQRVFVVRPGAVVVDRDLNPILDRLERVLEKRIRADAVDLGAALRDELEAPGVHAGFTDRHRGLSARDRERLDHGAGGRLP